MDYLNHLLKTLNKIALNFVERIPSIIVAIIFLIITYLTAKLIAHLVAASLAKTSLRSNLVIVLRKMITTFVWIIGLLVICAILFPSVTPANLIAALGLGTVAVGFAFKDILENVLAGIIILWREPFRIGDYIECKGNQGYVEHISIRNTHLRRSDGVRIVAPNVMLFTNPILVMTDMKSRREQITFGIGYNEDIQKTRSTIQKAIEKCKTVDKERAIQIFVKSFDAGNIEFEITWWTQSKPGEIRFSRDEVLSHIKMALDAEKIQISHTYTLSFDEPLSIKGLQEENN